MAAQSALAPETIQGVSAPTIAVVDGIPTTTSVEVARQFSRAHDEVLRRIRNLLEQLPDEHLRNFAEVFHEAIGGNGATVKYPAYRLTRDGFTLLAMGFTGKKALAFKLAYIDAFNRMESTLTQPANKPAQPLIAPSLKNRRWLVSFDHTGHEVVRAVPNDAFVLTWMEIADAIKAGEVPREALLAIAQEATQALYMQVCNDGGKGVAAKITTQLKNMAQTDLKEVANHACLELWMRAGVSKRGAAA